MMRKSKNKKYHSVG